jgi:hypothetical protein
MEKETARGSETTPWHIAFFEAIQMELDEYSRDLHFIYQHQLTTEPLRIDVVIIKKSRDVTIEKNIASIFRKENIVEYKSPEDYLSVKDFLKVYAYANLYAVLTPGVEFADITLTFVESRYPKELLVYLQEERGYAVEEKWPGIYIVSGDILPIQIIDNRKLSGDENIWLKDLDNKLEPPELRRIRAEIWKQGRDKAARIKAYLYVVNRANIKNLLEAGKMSDYELAIDELWDELLIETGIAARLEAKGRAEGEAWGEARGREDEAFTIAQNMVKLGLPIETVITATHLDPDKVKELYQQ